MAALAKKLIEVKRFRFGADDEIVDNLKAEKKEDESSRVLYSLSVSSASPGFFVLTSLWGAEVKKDLIGLWPQGYHMMGAFYPDPQRLINGWKRKVTEAIEQSTAVRSSVHVRESRFGPMPIPPVPQQMPMYYNPPMAMPAAPHLQPYGYGAPPLMIKWKVGDRCRAPWEDGKLYEAQVIEVLPGAALLIRYFPYGNTGTIPMAAVQPF